jgi:drug/metabolite transporter (DMT)-like permease
MLKQKAYAADLGAATLMGSMGVFVRDLPVDPQLIACARFGIGLLLLTALLTLTGRLAVIRTPFSWTLPASGFGIALCALFYMKAIKASSLTAAVFLLYLGPVLATLIAFVALKERLTLRHTLLVATAFLGYLCILEFNVALEMENRAGHVYGLLSAIFYALFIVINRTIPRDVPLPARAFYQLLSAALLLLLWPPAEPWHLRQTDVYGLIAVGFLYGFLAVSLMIYAMQYLKAYEYSTLAYVEPLVAALFGLLLYSESLSLLQVTGCVLIFASGLTQAHLSR